MEIFVHIVSLSVSGRCDAEVLEAQQADFRDRCFANCRPGLLSREVLEVQIKEEVKVDAVSP